MRNIALQEEAGIEVLTDGEVRRRFWFDPLTDEPLRIQPRGPRAGDVPRLRDKPDGPPPKLPAVTEKLGIRHNLPLEEIQVRQRQQRPAREGDAGRDDLRERALGPGLLGQGLPGPRGLHGRGDRADEADRRRDDRGRRATTSSSTRRATRTWSARRGRRTCATSGSTPRPGSAR